MAKNEYIKLEIFTGPLYTYLLHPQLCVGSLLGPTLNTLRIPIRW